MLLPCIQMLTYENKELEVLLSGHFQGHKYLEGFITRSAMRTQGKRRLWGDHITSFQSIKEAHKKDGERLFTKACSDKARSNDFKLEECRFRLDIRKRFFYDEFGETLEKVAQRSCECCIIASVQGKAR